MEVTNEDKKECSYDRDAIIEEDMWIVSNVTLLG